MYIIAGLGNPGKKYENTRHNMGFQALDLLADACDIKVDKLKFKALVGEGYIAGQKVLLMKPQTYMNLSGDAIREAVNFYKVEPENLIVMYDDLDIPLGTFRIRKKGSAGTHNGMRSVVSQVGSEDFPRIRVGIGSDKKGDLIDFVIGGVPKAEQEILRDTLKVVSKAAYAIVEKGVDKAMNEYNVKPKKDKPAKNPKPETGSAGEETV